MKHLYFWLTGLPQGRGGLGLGFPSHKPTTSHNQGFRNCISCTSHKVSKTRPQTSVNLNITWRDPGITYLGRGIFVETPAISWSQVPTLVNHLPIYIRNKATNKHFRYTEKSQIVRRSIGKSHWNIFYWNFLWSFSGGHKMPKKMSRKVSKAIQAQGIGHRT